MQLNKLLMIAIVVLLFAVNWLTFHDFFEPHTLRDWLLVAASLLVFIYFAKMSFRKLK